VVDNDLRQSEYQPLRALAEIGKRSLIVLNKTDLYTEADQEVILARLRASTGFIATTDVIAIAANPQSVILETGETLEPEPDIHPYSGVLQLSSS
jgi:GTPase SAR1 family protein